MRHRRSGKIFGRTGEERVQLARSLVVGVLLSSQGRIVTTIDKAKWVRGKLDSICCLLANVRAAEKNPVGRLNLVRKLSRALGGRGVIGDVLRNEALGTLRANGGNVRVVRLAERRIGDSGKTAVVELVRG